MIFRSIATSDAPSFRVVATNERDTLQKSSSRVTAVHVEVGDDLRVDMRRSTRVKVGIFMLFCAGKWYHSQQSGKRNSVFSNKIILLDYLNWEIDNRRGMK